VTINVKNKKKTNEIRRVRARVPVTYCHAKRSSTNVIMLLQVNYMRLVFIMDIEHSENLIII